MDLDKEQIKKQQQLEQEAAKLRDSITDALAFFPQLARMIKVYYDYLVSVGFKEEQALQIVSKYSSDVLTGR
jgi:hypothetical protein